MSKVAAVIGNDVVVRKTSRDILSLVAKHYVKSKFHLNVPGVTKGGRRQPFLVSSYHVNSPLLLKEKLRMNIWT